MEVDADVIPSSTHFLSILLVVKPDVVPGTFFVVSFH